MRLFCREDHDEAPDLCPPHEFTAGWDKDAEATGVIYCVLCGDVRPLTPPLIGAPLEEHVTADMER